MSNVDVLSELERRAAAEGRIAAALVELERHPGHILLSTATLTGRTAERWAAASAALAGLWRDFATHQRIVADAEAVRARKARPGEPELAELRRLLVEASIEERRTVVERRLSGDVVDVETITLPDLAERMESAFKLVDELVETCGALHAQLLAGLTPLAERANAARVLAHELGEDLTAVTARIAALDSEGTSDPLSLADGVLAARLAELDAELGAASAALAEHAAARAGWDDTIAALTSGIAALGPLRSAALDAWQHAAERIVGPVPEVPPDRTAALGRQLAELQAPGPWQARAAAAERLRISVAEAAGELRTAHQLATGLLERRAELRGRLEAFRAKATRLGHAERPELLALDSELRELLWSRPCDLAAATRALAAYQRHLHAPNPTDQQGRTA
ncbi:hypothetical protein [Pseudonocardia sp. TRM90224]|uniref:hypothetical protein n=1 Tax=Pseudonocardia sp. TRM90224 TaxID=2812678 RepID=UPI001E655374|nr:hypothetical protein [Pseudonocardia sp. TRM90224]